MRDAFQVVRGAVSTKDLVPVLTHFAVHESRIHGFDGRVHISAPCKGLGGMSFTVKADLLMAAIDACEGDPKLAADDRTVTITGGTFTATLPTGDMSQFPLPAPPAKRKGGVSKLPEVLKVLQPFIGEDASRPWCSSIKFGDGYACATNNVTLACCKLDTSWCAMPDCALPIFAVDELLRIGRAPTHVAQDGDHALVFYFNGDIWLRTTLVDGGWPDALAVVRAAHKDAKLRPIHPGLAAAVARVQPFCPDPKHPMVQLVGDAVKTPDGTMAASVGGLKGKGGAMAGAYSAPRAAACAGGCRQGRLVTHAAGAVGG